MPRSSAAPPEAARRVRRRRIASLRRSYQERESAPLGAAPSTPGRATGLPAATPKRIEKEESP